MKILNKILPSKTSVYLLKCVVAILSYDLCRCFTTMETSISFLNNHKLPMDVMTMFWYANIQTLIIMCILAKYIKKTYKRDIFNFHYYKNNKLLIVCLLFPIVASLFKTQVASYSTGEIIAKYKAFSPFITTGLAFIILKEKINYRFKSLFLITILGFLLTVSSFQFSINYILIFYVLVLSIGQIAEKWICSKRSNIDGSIIDNFLYSLVGVSGFLIYGGFELRYLFSWQVFIITIFSISAHILGIIGYNKAKTMSSINFVDLIAMGLSIFSAYIFFDKKASFLCILGFIIIFSANYINNKLITMYKYYKMSIKSIFKLNK